MNLALLANNIGLMWVAVEMATLTTVAMVGIYRTPASDRGGVEIFHSRQRRHRAGAVRHHPGLLAARPVLGERRRRRWCGRR
jgi:hydrogenase-4 component F